MTDDNRFLLSVVIPAHNEEKNLAPTVTELTQALREAGIRVVTRTKLGGFGRAIRGGLAVFRGDVVAIVMADRSDDPRDVVRYYRKIEEGYDCVFGSRFRRQSKVVNYPAAKLVVNRIVNRVVQLMFWCPFNDLTNAFKIYRREVVLQCGPYSSSHFNLTIEMSLSALIRRYHIAEIPICWYGRNWGASNLSIVAMGRRYLSTLLKVFFERLLIADDILEERLAERSLMAHRLGEFEIRLGAVESDVSDLHKSVEEPVADVEEHG